ncbi:MAG: hypothetical protein FJ044_00010 [Candidatus Cloacimonetes bacterium]|nr:hypothetical protein [Candidatus Cloacimonadota bacterium]
MRQSSFGETPQPVETIEKETTSSGFAQLLTVPEGTSLPEDKRRNLRAAADKIAELIYSPLRAGENTLSQESVPNATRELFAEPVERARQTLELFESVIRDLKGSGENAVASVVLNVKEKKAAEIIFLITPNTKSPDYKEGQTLGQIGSSKVGKVELIVKTAESFDEETYTPQTIKFIALDERGRPIALDEKGRPTETIRIEVHSAEKEKGKPQYVQVDAEIGGERLAVKHRNVEALGQNQEALDNFRLLQYAFLVNLAERIGTAESSFVDYKIFKRAKENLGLPVEEKKKTKPAAEERKELTLEELQQAANNVPPVLADYLGEPLYQIWEIPENGISPADKVLCYLFELEPHKITQEDIVVLNGRATRAMAVLTNFSDMEALPAEEALEIISKDPVLVRAGEKIMDELQKPGELISQLGQLATVQDLIKEPQ